jgi:hypothetical protein
MKRRSIKNAALADSDIPGLRRRILTKQTTVAQEADRFDVGIETIRRAVRGETFRHIRDYLDEPTGPGLRPEVATRVPVEPPDEIAQKAEESLKKVLGAGNKDVEEQDAVDRFLEARNLGRRKDDPK